MNLCANRDCNEFAWKHGFCAKCNQPSIRYTCVIVNKNENDIDPESIAYFSNGLDKLFGFKKFLKEVLFGRKS